jgi:branched-chain amino acid transport system ATP-binding protein
VWISVHSKSKRRWNPLIRAESLSETRIKAEEICKLVGLEDKMEEVAANLSYGDQKILEMAIAIGRDPSLLFLDEPVAGVSPKEAEKIVKVIKEISKGRTLVLIEHNIDLVLKLADKITVLDRGRVLAEGTPEEIRTNEKVQRVYFGAE